MEPFKKKKKEKTKDELKSTPWAQKHKLLIYTLQNIYL